MFSRRSPEKKKLPVCVVVGLGNKGIGDHCAKKWAKEGYAVAMLARRRENLEALEKEIPESRGAAPARSRGLRAERRVAAPPRPRCAVVGGSTRGDGSRRRRGCEQRVLRLVGAREAMMGRGAAAAANVAATRLHGISTSHPRHRRDAPPRTIHVVPAPPPRRAPRTIHVAPAPPPRRAFADYPRVRSRRLQVRRDVPRGRDGDDG